MEDAEKVSTSRMTLCMVFMMVCLLELAGFNVMVIKKNE